MLETFGKVIQSLTVLVLPVFPFTIASASPTEDMK